MRRLLAMVQMIIMSVIVAVMMIPAINGQASMRPISVTQLEKIFGNWYDSKGNLALTIGRDYTINGCQVVAAYDYSFDNNHRPNSQLPSRQLVCDESYRIIEKNGYRDIELDHFGHGYFKILVIDGKTILYNTINPKHFESVGGIYIGMNKNRVVSLYGQPSSITNERGNSIWKYSKEGFEVKFIEDFVLEIKMYSTGNRHLDITGLSCRDPLSSFVNKYPRISKFLGSWGKPDNLKGRIDGGGGVPIGYGEAIYFSNYPNSITLEINDFFAD